MLVYQRVAHAQAICSQGPKVVLLEKLWWWKPRKTKFVSFVPSQNEQVKPQRIITSLKSPEPVRFVIFAHLTREVGVESRSLAGMQSVMPACYSRAVQGQNLME